MTLILTQVDTAHAPSQTPSLQDLSEQPEDGEAQVREETKGTWKGDD